MPDRKYFLSLPERIIRATAAASGGILFEISQVLLPTWVRQSHLYQSLVARLLRITVEWIGDVQGVFPEDQLASHNLAVRKAAGNLLEVAGFLAIGWSPLWILAATADLTGGTKLYLNTLVTELQAGGLLSPDMDISSVDELLTALEGTTGQVADLVDVPPIQVEDMKTSWAAMKQNVAALPEPGRLATIFTQLRGAAREGNIPIETASAILATSAMRAGLKLGHVHIFDFYRLSLKDINKEGWSAYTFRVLKPYFATAGGHFEPRRQTSTDALLTYLSRRRRLPPSPGSDEAQD